MNENLECIIRNRVKHVHAPIVPEGERLYLQGTSLEKITADLFYAVNDVIKFVNNTLGCGVGEAVLKVLEEWLENGVFDELIKSGIYPEFYKILQTIQRDIVAIIAEKRDKTDVGYVTMAKLADDVKKAITGGSVAVVGADSVGTSAIKNGAVGPAKLSAMTRTIYRNSMNSLVNIDTVNGIVSLRGAADNNNFVFLVGGEYKSIAPTFLTAPPKTDTAYWLLYNPANNQFYWTENKVLESAVIGYFNFTSEKTTHGNWIINYTLQPGFKIAINGIVLTEFDPKMFFTNHSIMIDYYNNTVTLPLRISWANSQGTTALNMYDEYKVFKMPNNAQSTASNAQWLTFDLYDNAFRFDNNYARNNPQRFFFLGWVDMSRRRYWFPEISVIDMGQSFGICGDSITSNIGVVNANGDQIRGSFPEYISEAVNGYPLNVSVSGMGYTRVVNGRKMIDQLMAINDYMNGGSGNRTIRHGILCAGHNDHYYSQPMTDFTNDVDTCMKYIRDTFNTIPFLVCTPFPYKKGLTPNSQGYTLEDYVNVIREKAKLYRIRLYDLFEEAPVDVTNDAQTAILIPDGRHPSYHLHRKVAYEIKNMLI